MPYNFVADSIHINFVADFLQVKCTFNEKQPFCVLSLPLGLVAMHAVHLRLIEKRVVDSLQVIIELF